MLKNSDYSWGAVAKVLHWAMALLIIAHIVLGVLVVLTVHVAAALHHHFRKRDNVLTRMVSGKELRL